jgi:hypothetical protein
MRLIFCCLFLLTSTYSIFSQVKIGNNVSNLAPHTVLELESQNAGFLQPRLSNAQRDALQNPPEGLRIYNTDTKCENYYNGSAWHELCGVCVPGIPPQPNQIFGNIQPCAGDTQSLYWLSASTPQTQYQWSFPNGWSILSGQGNDTVRVQAGQVADSGMVSVIAQNGCGSSPAQQVNLYPINANLTQVQPANAQASATQIVWFWHTVQGAGGYLVSSQNNASQTQLVSDTSFLEINLTPCQADSLYVWPVNACDTGQVQLLLAQTICQQSFQFTGSMQSFVIPAGVTQITIDCYGAQGFDSQFGGRGGHARAQRSVNPGETYYVFVGGEGTGNNGGWNGGESTAAGSGCLSTTGGTGYGGGASDVRFGGTALSNRIIVAGGGGGMGLSGPCGNTSPLPGGAGGGLTGAPGASAPSATGGGGGSQSSGGSAGSGNFGSATAGSLGQGGDRCPGDMTGGDGGGGYYGGGGGGGNNGCNRGAGGGGSNYFGGLSPLINAQGVRSGNGLVVITY